MLYLILCTQEYNKKINIDHMRKFREINQLYNIKPNTHASTDLSESI